MNPSRISTRQTGQSALDSASAMTIRTLCLLLLMALHVRSAPPTLKEIPAYQQGLEAMGASLWEIAETRFEEVLKTPELPASLQRTIRLKQLETWIRSDRPAEALAKLNEPYWRDEPQTYFWKSQALAGLGRYREAAEGLAPALTDSKAPFRSEALFTRAGLLLSLDLREEALATLEVLVKTGDSRAIRLARLRQTAILIDLGKTSEARKALPEPKLLGPEDLPEHAFLNARLLLMEGKAEAAASAFALLYDKPQGQSQLRYHAAILGLADALAASSGTSAAADSLLAALQRYPDSPMLGPIFQRLQEWLPAQPAPNDAILERLAQWSPAIPPLATGIIPTLGSGAVGARPSASSKPAGELAAYALYTRAIGLRRQSTPDAKAEALRLLTRLRIEHPQHFLANKALMLSAKWLLDDKRSDRAFAALAALRLNIGSSQSQGEAAFLEAKAEFDRGNPNAAAMLFDQAASLLPESSSNLAALNAALVRLKSDGLSGGSSANASRDALIRENLELERALSETNPDQALDQLKSFLHQYPQSRRLAEALLAATEAALRADPPDLDFARNQIQALDQIPNHGIPPLRLNLAKLRIADREPNPLNAIQQSREFLKAFSGSPETIEAEMILGRALYRNGDYHNARLTLEKLAANNPENRISPAALLLAARSAALGATAQSREESLILFEKVANGTSGLAPLARLERARILNDLNRLDITINELQPWFRRMKPTDPLRIPAGLLLAEALYAQGTARPASLSDALEVYDQLLITAEKQPAVLNRLHYLRGMTLELLPRRNGQPGNREREALESYYRVLQTDGNQPPAEWEWFERCGFRALKLLEDAGRWEAAISTATRIASFKGPRAEEAAARAKQLRLEHMIWED